MSPRKVRRALISVSDKQGIVEFSRRLSGAGVEILSTGGTAQVLREASIPVKDVSEYTGFPEIMDGRVKTLHPKVHGGILAVRDDPEHVRQMSELGIEPIDMVVVNLYPFGQTIARPGSTFEEAIENIDIGGPTMIRSAAKNFRDVAVVVEPRDYERVASELEKGGGMLSEQNRFELAKSAFRHTALYDSAISGYLDGRDEGRFSKTMFFAGAKVRDLRYGENPHQKAALFRDLTVHGASLASAECLGGKELSFNNFLDLEAALSIVREFERPAAVVIKHTNPCGAAVASSLAEAFDKAYDGDPISAFGSVVGFNRPVDKDTALRMTLPDRFVEAVIAPEFEAEAREILTTKPKWGKNVRLVRTGDFSSLTSKSLEVKTILGGFLVQEPDEAGLKEMSVKVVTEKSPTPREMKDLEFAWLVSKHVKSNAIVLAKGEAVVGVGAGQMSRLDSTLVAIRKAASRSKGAVLASDAFFPFSDAVIEAANAGVVAIIQTGGAKADADVIEVANRLKMAVLLTGQRHFKH